MAEKLIEVDSIRQKWIFVPVKTKFRFNRLAAPAPADEMPRLAVPPPRYEAAWIQRILA